MRHCSWLPLFECGALVLAQVLVLDLSRDCAEQPLESAAPTGQGARQVPAVVWLGRQGMIQHC